MSMNGRDQSAPTGVINAAATAFRRIWSARPGDGVRIDWPAEDEQTGSAGGKGDGDRDQHALAWGENSTRRAESNISGDIGGGEPVQVALIARPRKHAREADVGSVALAVEMPHNAH